MLNLPLATGRVRNGLREKWCDILFSPSQQNERGNYGTAPKGGDRTGAGSASKEIGADWQNRLEKKWKGEHPAVALLELGKSDREEKGPADTSAENLAAQGDKVRAGLNDLISGVQQDCRKTRDQLAEKEVPANIRQGWCSAERALRASAALFAGGPPQDFKDDPIAELRQFDLHKLLLWQASRTMDDFWGSDDFWETKVNAETPYFEVVARDEIACAGKCIERLPGGRASLPDAKPLLEQLTALSTASKNALQPSVDPDKVPIDGDAKKNQQMTVTVDPGVPSGEAAAFLDYPGGPGSSPSLLPWRRLPVKVPAAKPVLLEKYAITKNWEGRDWRAMAFYRGHVGRKPFQIAAIPPGPPIVYTPQHETKASIGVFRESKAKTSIMFILDCSGSMGKSVAGGTKLDAARKALFDAIDLLATDKEACRVGVMAYAHRVAWVESVVRNANNEQVKVWQLDPLNPNPAGLTPNTDIEVFNFSGRAIDPLDARRLADIEGRLRKLEPRGSTPLYHAIMEAIDKLNEDVESEQKRIVVLTDGVDNQWPYTDGWIDKYIDRYINEINKVDKKLPDIYRSEERTALENTVEKLDAKLNLGRNRGIDLDIIGFQIDDDKGSPEYQHMLRLVEKLNREGRGSYVEAGNKAELQAAFHKMLNLDQYQVLYMSGERVGEPLELNKSCEVKPGDFQVAIVPADRAKPAEVHLDGGEGIELYYDRGRLVHHRYNHDELLPVGDWYPRKQMESCTTRQTTIIPCGLAPTRQMGRPWHGLLRLRSEWRRNEVQPPAGGGVGGDYADIAVGRPQRPPEV